MVLDEAALLGEVSAKVGFVLPLAAGIACAGVEDRVTTFFQVEWLVSSLKCFGRFIGGKGKKTYQMGIVWRLLDRR